MKSAVSSGRRSVAAAFLWSSLGVHCLCCLLGGGLEWIQGRGECGQCGAWAGSSWNRCTKGGQRIINLLFRAFNALIFNGCIHHYHECTLADGLGELGLTRGGGGPDAARARSYPIHRCGENLFPLPQVLSACFPLISAPLKKKGGPSHTRR